MTTTSETCCNYKKQNCLALPTTVGMLSSETGEIRQLDRSPTRSRVTPTEKVVWLRRRRRRTTSQSGVVIDLHVASDGPPHAVETGEIRQLGVVIDLQVASDGPDAVETCESRQLGVVPDPQVASDGRDAVETSESRQLGVVPDL